MKISSILLGLIFLTTIGNGIFAFDPYESCDFEDTHIWRQGSKKYYPLEFFSGFFNYPNASCVDNIRIKNMEINPKTFVQELIQFKNLKSLDIEVEWKGNLDGKIMLPSIFDVRIKRRNWKLGSSTQSEIDSMFFISTTPINDLFNSPDTFILKGETWPGASIIYSLGTLQLVNVNTNVFKYFQQFNGLTVEDSSLDMAQIKGKTLSDFDGKKITLKNGNMTDLLKIISNSTKISLKNIQDERKEILTIDLSFINLQNLTSLTLDNFIVESSQVVSFESLESITIQNSIINWTRIYSLGSNTLNTLTFENNTMIEFTNDVFTNLKTLSAIDLKRNPNYGIFNIDSLANSSKTLTSIDLNGLELSCLELCDRIVLEEVTWLGLENCMSVSESFIKQFTQILPKLTSSAIDNTVPFELFMEMNRTKLDYLIIKRLFAINEPKFLNFLTKVGVPVTMEAAQISRYEDEPWAYNGEKDEDVPTTANAIFYSYLISLLIFCLFGILGNMTSVFILGAKRLRSPTNTILIVLAIFDTIVLICFISSLLVHGFKLVSLILKIYKFKFGLLDRGTEIQILGNDPIETLKIHENIQGYLMYPLGKTAFTGSVYTTILITIERFVAVCWPLHIKSFTSIKKSLLMTFSILVFSIMLNLPRWFEAYGSTVEVRLRRDPKKLAVIIPKLERVYSESNFLLHSFYRTYYHNWLWTILMYGIPIITLIYLNVRILSRVKQSITNRKALSETSVKNTNDESKSITIMLVCISLIFVTCNIANGILLWIFVTCLDYDPKDVESISNIPVIINSSANFIIYILLGRKFRQELKRKFSVCFTKPNNQNFTSGVSNSSSFTEASRRRNQRT